MRIIGSFWEYETNCNQNFLMHFDWFDQKVKTMNGCAISTVDAIELPFFPQSATSLCQETWKLKFKKKKKKRETKRLPTHCSPTKLQGPRITPLNTLIITWVILDLESRMIEPGPNWTICMAIAVDPNTIWNKRWGQPNSHWWRSRK